MTKNKKLPRGLRNNNPLNIRRGATPWMGEVKWIERKTGVNADDSEAVAREYDRTFCQFDNMAHGWRATFLLLKKYINVYKCNTIRKIITRWAPPNENYTDMYIGNVVFHSCTEADTVLHFSDDSRMLSIAAAMCMVENGADYDPLLNKEWCEAMWSGYRIALESKTWSEK